MVITPEIVLANKEETIIKTNEIASILRLIKENQEVEEDSDKDLFRNGAGLLLTETHTSPDRFCINITRDTSLDAIQREWQVFENRIYGIRNDGFVATIISRFLLAMVVIGIILGISSMFPAAFDKVFQILETLGFSHSDAFFNQVSVTFIVISVVTVFTSATQMAYWEDVMRFELVKPRFWNFTSIAAYLFASLFVDVILILASSDYIFLNFIISIILICILTIKMMAAFFARDYILHDLETKYRRAKSFRYIDENKRHAYQEYKILLLQTSLQEIEDNQFDRVSENFKMLIRNREYEDAEYLLNQMLKEDNMYLISSIVKTGRYVDMKAWSMFEKICEKALSVDSEMNVKHTTSIMKSLSDEVFELIEHFYTNPEKRIADNIDSEVDTRIVIIMLRYIRFCLCNNYMEAYENVMNDYLKGCDRTAYKLTKYSNENHKFEMARESLEEKGSTDEGKEIHQLFELINESAVQNGFSIEQMNQIKHLKKMIEIDWVRKKDVPGI